MVYPRRYGVPYRQPATRGPELRESGLFIPGTAEDLGKEVLQHLSTYAGLIVEDLAARCGCDVDEMDAALNQLRVRHQARCEMKEISRGRFKLHWYAAQRRRD
jgi:hypothetical protein